jgi:hypothetical protein
VSLTDEDLSEVIVRLLEVGVPPTAIGKAFDIDSQAIRSIQADLHITQYGTAELGEAMLFTIWRGYDMLLQLMEEAPLQQRIRISTWLVARGSALAGSTTPDSIVKMQTEMEELAKDLVPQTLPETGTIYKPDFVEQDV